MSAPRHRPPAAGPSGLELVEEAVHLLRRAPAAAWVAYGAGAVPWVCGVVYFWARTSWFAPDTAERAAAALALVALFAALKAGQSAFCAHLLALRLGAPPPAFPLSRLRSLAVSQISLHAWGWFALPIAAVVAAPFGWLYAFYQNTTVLAAGDPATPPPRGEAWRLAELWPAQNHIGLLLLKLLALAVWVNLAAGFYLVPWLANRFLALPNILGVHGVALFNTTFLALVTLLAWLAVDPLVKAFYVLRVFHGRARRTGDDLRTELAATRPRRTSPATAVARAAVVLLVAALLCAPPSGRAATEAAPPPPPAADTAAPLELDRAIDHALQDGDFQWALRPLPRTEDDRPRNAIERFAASAYEFLTDILRSIRRAVSRLLEWLFGRHGAGSSPNLVPGNLAGAKILLWVLLAAVLLGLCWVAFNFWRRTRAAPATGALAARAVAAAAPDLRDETVQAAQLPCDGWLDLARRQLAAGEWRLALRALYLATLARRAAEGLLVLARAKTNLDYERELARRAVARPDLVAHFRQRRRSFEDVWYGDSAASEEQVRAWLAEFLPPSPTP